MEAQGYMEAGHVRANPVRCRQRPVRCGCSFARSRFCWCPGSVLPWFYPVHAAEQLQKQGHGRRRKPTRVVRMHAVGWKHRWDVLCRWQAFDSTGNATAPMRAHM